jgi:nucleoside-diphosphate-sugar epimerase
VTNWRRARGVRAAIVRVFNTYGPGMRLDDGRVVPEFLAAASSSRPLPIQGDGLQTRSYMFISDLVDGLLHVALDPELDGLLLNVGNPEEVTVSELAARVLRLSGSTGGTTITAGRPGDPQRRRPDIDRMQSRYGWHPVVTLDDGLQRTIDWVRTTRVTAGDTRA